MLCLFIRTSVSATSRTSLSKCGPSLWMWLDAKEITRFLTGLCWILDDGWSGLQSVRLRTWIGKPASLLILGSTPLKRGRLLRIRLAFLSSLSHAHSKEGRFDGILGRLPVLSAIDIPERLAGWSSPFDSGDEGRSSQSFGVVLGGHERGFWNNIVADTLVWVLSASCLLRLKSLFTIWKGTLSCTIFPMPTLTLVSDSGDFGRCLRLFWNQTETTLRSLRQVSCQKWWVEYHDW